MTDISDLITPNAIIFGTPFTLMYEPLWTKLPYKAKIDVVCKLCGYVITVYDVSTVENVLMGAMRYYHDRFRRHLLCHRFDSLRFGMSITPDSLCVSMVMMYIMFGENGNKLIEARDLLNEIKQLAFITPTHNMADFHDQLLEKFNIRPYERTNTAHILYIFEHDYIQSEEFKREYVLHMMSWNYECTTCGIEYESGLPSIEMVIEHMEDCVRVVNGTMKTPLEWQGITYEPL